MPLPRPLSLTACAAMAVMAFSLPALAATTRPELVHRVEPEYPAALRDLAEDGTVSVSFVVSPEGRVAELRIDRSSNRAFNDCVRAALEQWRYEPARRDGAPTRSGRLREDLDIFAPLDRKLAVLAQREVFVALSEPVVEEKDLVSRPFPISGAHVRVPSPIAREYRDKAVTISFAVDTDGLPVNPSADSADDAALARNTFVALLAARWRPMVVDDKPVSFRATRAMGLISPDEIGFLDLEVARPPALLFATSSRAEQPAIVSQVAPIFPPEVSAAGASGIVLVAFIVGPDGRVHEPRVESASLPAIANPAVEAVRQWTFRPGRVDGRPVATRMTAPIVFNHVPNR